MFTLKKTSITEKIKKKIFYFCHSSWNFRYYGNPSLLRWKICDGVIRFRVIYMHNVLLHQ